MNINSAVRVVVVAFVFVAGAITLAGPTEFGAQKQRSSDNQTAVQKAGELAKSKRDESEATVLANPG